MLYLQQIKDCSSTTSSYCTLKCQQIKSPFTTVKWCNEKNNVQEIPTFKARPHVKNKAIDHPHLTIQCCHFTEWKYSTAWECLRQIYPSLCGGLSSLNINRKQELHWNIHHSIINFHFTHLIFSNLESMYYILYSSASLTDKALSPSRFLI